MLLRSSCWLIGIVLCLVMSLAGRTHGGATCPAACTCEKDSATCSASNLTVLPTDFPDNQTVTRLFVSRTGIRTLENSSFSDLRELLSIDFSNNQLEKIADGTFVELNKLHSLTLRRNWITQLTKDTFLGLVNLTFLDLSYNRLNELPDFGFHQLKNLEVLDLARNTIETETSLAFAGLSSLKTLNLTRNYLIILNPEMFVPLVSLETLIVDDSNIKIIPNETFAPLVALKQLSLNGNHLTIGPKAFLNETEQGRREVPLELLSLKGTQLKELPVQLLQTLMRLKSLDVSNISIEVVSNASFSELSELVNLTIDSCSSLKEIESGAFTGLGKLQNLIITNNMLLKEIGWGAFKNLSSLKFLDLRRNGVEIFRASMADWEDIGRVDLRGNPIRCDCHTWWILELLNDPVNATVSPGNGPALLISREGGNSTTEQSAEYFPAATTITTSSLTRQINCTAPPSLQGRPLTSLSADDFRCPTSARKRPDRNGNEKRFKVGVIVASITCFGLICFSLFVKFRKQICSACRGQYRYKAYHNNGVNGGSPSVEIMEMEDTQFEDLESDADTKMKV